MGLVRSVVARFTSSRYVVTTRLIPASVHFSPPLPSPQIDRLVTEKTVTMKLYYLEQSGKRLPISLSLSLFRLIAEVASRACNVSSRKNRDNESLLSRNGENSAPVTNYGSLILWYAAVEETRRDGKEWRVTIVVESAADRFVTVRVDLSRQHKIFHFHFPKKLRDVPRKRGVCCFRPACGCAFFFFSLSLSACSQVGWRGDKNGEQHYTDLSVGLVLRFFFAPFRERGRIAATTFYSHNLIISALWPGPPSSSGLEIRRPYNASHKSS